jgi:NAD(P)-dependent dehydrogenase (short-subunit alcohol dehydrogenase family)
MSATNTAPNTAVVIGVSALDGLGATLCHDAAAQGLHVVIAGRQAERIDAVAASVRAGGGQATTVVADATDETSVTALIAAAEAIGPIDLAIYNAGNNFRGNFLEMTADYFETAWRVVCFGGFLFAREALKAMTPRGAGTLIFTGASASMRGKPNFAAFTAGKAGLRAMAQSLAREFSPQGIHIGHVVIDGGINGERLKSANPGAAERLGGEGLIGLQGISDAYIYLYRQPRNAWTHELDLRTHKEIF